MARSHYPSLLDDPEFLEALDRLEVGVPPADERPMNQWFVELHQPEPRPKGKTAPPEAPRPAVVETAFFIATFLFMMGIGGAAAAYVFADQVVLLVSR